VRVTESGEAPGWQGPNREEYRVYFDGFATQSEAISRDASAVE
jgi:hypothetical protein